MTAKTKLLLTATATAVAILARAEGHSPVASAEIPHFPKVTASNLESQEFSLPSQFEGERNLVLIAFEREQQKDVDSWLPAAKRIEEHDPRFRYYELPTIERVNALARWFINSGMRRGIPDRKSRERTITLYLDKQAFCRALHIENPKAIHAFLVDRSGTVLWQAEGDFDGDKGETLRRAVEGGAQ